MAWRVRAEPASAPAGKSKKHISSLDRTATAINVLAQNGAIRGRQDEIAGIMAAPVDELHAIESGLRYWLSFARAKCSAPDLDAWRPLCEAVNLGMILAENDIGAAYLDLFIAAQEALFHAWQYGLKTGSYQLRVTAEVQTIARALAVHDAQIACALRGDLAIAERTMLKRLNDGDKFEAEPLAA